MQESTVEGVGTGHRFISNLFDKKIEETFALLREFINWIGCAKGQSGSLTHPEFIA